MTYGWEEGLFEMINCGQPCEEQLNCASCQRNLIMNKEGSSLIDKELEVYRETISVLQKEMGS